LFYICSDHGFGLRPLVPRRSTFECDGSVTSCDGGVMAETAEGCRCDGVMDRIARILDSRVVSKSASDGGRNAAFEISAGGFRFDSNAAANGKSKLSV
jgi:hypothetical protein